MSSDRISRQTLASLLSWLTVLLFLLAAAGSWTWFLADLQRAAETTGAGSVSESLGFETDEFRQSMAAGLRDYLHVMHWLGIVVANLLWLVPLVTIPILSRMSRLGGLGVRALALLPLLFGIARVPWEIRHVFRALAEAGLSNPGLIAIGMAEALAPALVGGAATLALLVTWLVLARRGAAGPDSTPAWSSGSDRA